MKRISEITKRDIFDIIRSGYIPPGTIDKYFISWCGRLDQVTFLKRLYDLTSLPSNDRRFKTAEGDIQTHTANFLDWDTDWILDDDRFGLVDGEDVILLNFLCEMVHPVVRLEHQSWQLFVDVFNELLKYDGYELYEKRQISGRLVYHWRDIFIKNTFIQKQTESIVEKFNSEYIATQIKNMNDMIEISPGDAIGKAKELFESCCKTILKKHKIIFDSDWDVPRLTKETCKILSLTPSSVTDTTKANETIRKMLGNLSSMSQSIAELRNSYGSGHGKGADFKGLNPRHARLAVGSAVTAVHFIWETYEEEQRNNNF